MRLDVLYHLTSFSIAPVAATAYVAIRLPCGSSANSQVLCRSCPMPNRRSINLRGPGSRPLGLREQHTDYASQRLRACAADGDARPFHHAGDSHERQAGSEMTASLDGGRDGVRCLVAV
jgi:hypothetical protein